MHPVPPWTSETEAQHAATRHCPTCRNYAWDKSLMRPVAHGVRVASTYTAPNGVTANRFEALWHHPACTTLPGNGPSTF